HFITTVIIFIFRVVFPSGLPDGSPILLVPLRAESIRPAAGSGSAGRLDGAPRRCPFGAHKGHAGEITYISGSPPLPFHHNGYYIHFPRGFPIRLAGWEPCFIGSAAGGINPPGGRVRLRRTPGRRAAPVPLWGIQ